MKNISNLQEFTVSDLSKGLKNVIEDKFSYIKLTGEISGFKRHSSGHCYFALKDEKSVIDAVIWKGNASKLTFPIQDGLEVSGTGKVTTYAGRSKYQIILDDIKPAGAGALMALFEALKKKLSEEGLFREELKQPLPFLPKSIAVITSPTGAVIRDILHRLNDRFFPHIYVFPVAVQGDLSARQVSYALKFFNKCTTDTAVKRPDVIIIARGGGSVEDLWSFNEEIVARSVAASQIPVISAVGHETDFTLCDFAADKRAPTPTAAAEMATPIKSDLSTYIETSESRLISALKNRVTRQKERYQFLVQKIPDIKSYIDKEREQIDKRANALSQSLKQNIWSHHHTYNRYKPLLRKQIILSLIENHKKQNIFNTTRLIQAIQNKMSYQKQDIKLKRQLILQKSAIIHEKMKGLILQHRDSTHFKTKILENMSYKNVLQRGFAVIHSNDVILTNIKDAKQQAPTKIQFKDGEYVL